MQKDLINKYIAIKPSGFDHYIWFEAKRVLDEAGWFIGKSGWGKSGALTNIECRTSEIDSYIYSDTLQYL